MEVINKQCASTYNDYTVKFKYTNLENSSFNGNLSKVILNWLFGFGSFIIEYSKGTF